MLTNETLWASERFRERVKFLSPNVHIVGGEGLRKRTNLGSREWSHSWARRSCLKRSCASPRDAALGAQTWTQISHCSTSIQSDPIACEPRAPLLGATVRSLFQDRLSDSNFARNFPTRTHMMPGLIGICVLVWKGLGVFLSRGGWALIISLTARCTVIVEFVARRPESAGLNPTSSSFEGGGND